MLEKQFFEKKQLIDWCREAEEEIKTLRFCPNCGQLVMLKLQEHKHAQNFYSCERCGELFFRKRTSQYDSKNKTYGNNRRPSRFLQKH